MLDSESGIKSYINFYFFFSSLFLFIPLSLLLFLYIFLFLSSFSHNNRVNQDIVYGTFELLKIHIK